MKIGLFHQMWAHAALSDAEFFAQAIADVRWADELGFDSFWMGEHHLLRNTPFYGRVPIPELMVARLAGETSQIKLGTGVKILTVAHPMRFAESMTTLDLLTQGRVVFGVGQGSGGDIQQAGFTGIDKRAQFRSNLMQVLDYLKTGPDADKPCLTPPPSPGLVDKLWIASRDAETVSLIAQHGLNLLVGQAEAPVKQAEYVRHYRQQGRPGSSGQVCGCRLVHVAETDAEALRQVEVGATLYFNLYSKGVYYQEAVAEGRIPATPPESLTEMLDRLDYWVGSPQTVAQKLQSYCDTVGLDLLNVMVHIPGLAEADVRRSMQLVIQEVAPQLRPTLSSVA
ncbi:MAG: LLM class flavin-dependent oxidoreductase [Thermostichus sp. HHBFW_bins_43]